MADDLTMHPLYRKGEVGEAGYISEDSDLAGFHQRLAQAERERHEGFMTTNPEGFLRDAEHEAERRRLEQEVITAVLARRRYIRESGRALNATEDMRLAEVTTEAVDALLAFLDAERAAEEPK